VSDDLEPGVEAVARWLCLAAEYHAQHWRLYVPKARAVIEVYRKAVACAS